MTMMITKFHKLIQSKIVWYIILGIIVIAFVGFFTPTMRSEKNSTKSKPAGKLFGKKVTMQEYRQAYHNAYIWYLLSVGQMIPLTDELSIELQKETWRWMAGLRKAKQKKVFVTDAEVVRQIQTMPLFINENGVFNPAVYKGVCQSIRLTPTEVEELFREQISLHKLMYPYTQAALIPPSELDRLYHTYTDRFVLSYVLLPREEVAKGIAVSREKAEALFEENPEAFRMSAKVRVSYVEFPISNFLAQAEIPEEAALQIYNRNLENYRIENTNEFAEIEYQAFETVEEEITEQLCEIEARRLATLAASELVAEIAPKSEGTQPDFRGAVETTGLETKTIPSFGPSGPLPEIDAPVSFRQAAFRLQNDPFSSFSDAIMGKNFIYVLSLEQRYDSFIPSFDAVKKEAMDVARQQATSEALAKRALEIQETVETKLIAGDSFVEAIKPFGLQVENTEEFDLPTGFDGPYADTLISLCPDIPQHKFCELTPTENGMLISYVAERTSTDSDLGLPAIREDLVTGLVQRKEQRLLASWQKTLLKEAHFKNLIN